MGTNSRLKVLHVGKFYPPHIGGIETHLHLLAGELRKSVDIRVLVANDARISARDIVDGVDVSRAGTVLTVAGAPVCPAMACEIRRAKADLVHLHLPNPMAVISYLLSRHKGRLVATWHSDVVRQRSLARLFGPLQRFVLNKSSAIIATSPNYIHTSKPLSRYQDRCQAIPYGIPVETFREYNAHTVKIRERYGPRVALCVGRLVYYKGIQYLIRAMANVKAKLLVVGDGPMRETLEDESRERGLADRVEFMGAFSDPSPFFQACDVFVLPSVARSEAFGIVQLEAMACGKPVVNTRLASGVPFVSIDGITGITVPPADPDALARAINRLLDDPVRAATYGHAGLRRVREEFSVEQMANSTLGLYDEVMSASVNGNRNGGVNGRTYEADPAARNGRQPMSATAA